MALDFQQVQKTQKTHVSIALYADPTRRKMISKVVIASTRSNLVVVTDCAAESDDSSLI
jgi:hypothetical protein